MNIMPPELGVDWPEATAPVSGADLTPLAISGTEWIAARNTPPVVVNGYMFHDLFLTVAAGGVGKTTLMLWESVCIALGRAVFGFQVENPGMTVIVTAEDSREKLIARLRSICAAIDLTDQERATVMNWVRPIYVGGSSFRLSVMEKDMVEVGPETDRLIEELRNVESDLRQVVIDPAVSFGVGETRVNDSEQGLVNACRRIRDQLGVCPRIIHHTGKQNARDGTTDQYSARGGTALPDGSRTVQVINKMKLNEWQRATGDELQPEEVAFRISMPKTTHSAPVADFFVKRRGYMFTRVNPATAADALTHEQLEELKELIAADGAQKRDSQSPQWFGHLIAKVMGRDSGEGLMGKDMTDDQKAVRDLIKPIAKWLLEDEQSPLGVVKRKRTNDNRPQEFVVVRGED